MAKIIDILARRILDSRKEPTLEVEVKLDSKEKVKASVPAGKSTGASEAKPQNVEKAIKNINEIISPKLKGKDPTEQKDIDNLMIKLDGTNNKSKLGANAILGVSFACCRAGALSKNLPLYKYIHSIFNFQFSILNSLPLPTPMFNLINGGKHAQNNLSWQEFLIVPLGFKTFSEKLEASKKIFKMLKEILPSILNLNPNLVPIGDEGGFAPNFNSEKEALDVLLLAIKKAGFENKVKLSLDIAAEHRKQPTLNEYLDLIKKYPILSIEDPFPEDDWNSWSEFSLSLIANRLSLILVGDDLFTTNPERLKMGIQKKVAGAILIKPNQIGTLTETLNVIKLAIKNNLIYIISHRSGETEDSFIADLAVGTGAKFIKAGAPNKEKPERMVKYNRLIEIENELNV